MREIWVIFRKEMIDALRDRRTLMIIALSSLITVPLMLFVFSTILGQVESEREKRIVYAVGIQDAPSLENYITRQGYKVESAPNDYVDQLRSKKLQSPVLIVPAKFEDKLAELRQQTLEIAYDTGNRQSESGVRPLRQLINGFSTEVGMQNLNMRGISAELVQAIEVREREVQKPEERRSVFVAMLPMIVLLAIFTGGLNAAIDTTAGERERGSIEPLLMNPVNGWTFTLGKWAAITMLGGLVMALILLSFFPTQAIITSDVLKAEFQFTARDAIYFGIILFPMAAMFAAVEILMAMGCKSFREAQARVTFLIIIIQFASIAPMLIPGKEPEWAKFIPIYSQTHMLTQILKNETVTVLNYLSSTSVVLAITLVSLVIIARRIRTVSLSS